MLTHAEQLTLIEDIVTAERLGLPGPAKHGWVLAHQLIRRAQSPPPSWIWLLAILLEKLIPIVLDWLKKKYGDQWPETTSQLLLVKKLPWE